MISNFFVVLSCAICELQSATSKDSRWKAPTGVQRCTTLNDSKVTIFFLGRLWDFRFRVASSDESDTHSVVWNQKLPVFSARVRLCHRWHSNTWIFKRFTYTVIALIWAGNAWFSFFMKFGLAKMFQIMTFFIFIFHCFSYQIKYWYKRTNRTFSILLQYSTTLLMTPV